MPKDNCLTKFRLIHLILILLGLFGSGVATWVWQQAEAKAIAKEVEAIVEEAETLTAEGCKPANRNMFDIALIQKDIVIIQKTQKTMSLEQKEGFKEILKRLPK